VIYYSHINEDNSVEHQILNTASYEDLFCIAGSGERLISLLDHPSLKRIHIVDNSMEALYLTQLKLAVLKAYPVAEYLDFLGMAESNLDRTTIFEKIKNNLSEDCVKFWQDHLKYIRKGILHAGHFEKFLSNVRPLLKIYLGKHFYQCFSIPFHTCKAFPNMRWTLLRWFFSKRWVYLLAGNKDIAFVSKNGQQHLIPEALHQTLLEDVVNKNPLFHLVFNGHLNMMPKEHLPSSFNYEALNKIKNILQGGRLEIHYYNQDILAFGNSFDFTQCGKSFYSLSDILSFVNLDYIKQLIKTIRDRSHSNSTIVLRTFIRNRMSEDQLKKLEKDFGAVKDLSHLENTKMYQVYEMYLEK
jgi:S-adenosylmethionine:diacylglycerol 3-amino-3-carboxypropyl transferase